MATVDQPSVNPTRKLTTATIGAAAMAVIGLVLKNLAPEWYDPPTLMAMTPIVIFALGWFTRDHATVVIVEGEDQ